MVVVSDMKEGSRCELGMFIGWRHLIDNTSEAEQGDNNASFLLPTHTRLMLLSHCASLGLFVALTLIHPPASHERRTSRLAQHCVGPRHLCTRSCGSSTLPRAITKRTVSCSISACALDIYNSKALMSTSVNRSAGLVLHGYTIRYVASRLASVPCSSCPILA